MGEPDTRESVIQTRWCSTCKRPTRHLEWWDKVTLPALRAWTCLEHVPDPLTEYMERVDREVLRELQALAFPEVAAFYQHYQHKPPLPTRRLK